MTVRTGEPVLLFDGHCGLCNGAVRFLLRHDPDGLLKFASLGGEFSAGVLRRHAWLGGMDTLVLVECAGTEGERILTRSEAVLRLAAYLGGPWRLCGLFRIVPRSVRDFLYDGVARRRYRVFGRHDVCPIYPADVRPRFLA